MTVRTIAWVLSFAIHLAVASSLFISLGNASLESGEGEDMFTVEQGIAIEGIAKFGEAEIATEAVEVQPMEASEARPEIEEVKAEEKVEEDELLTSEQGPVQEEIPEVKPEPLEEPRPAQTATLEQVEQLKVEELQSSGQSKTAGSATEKSKYLGKLRYHLEGKKVNPRSQQVGTVIVQFTVNASGELVERRVVTSSGSKTLDDAALASIEKAAPFPPVPDTVGEEKIVVSVPFRFSVR